MSFESLEKLQSRFLESQGYRIYKCPICGDHYYGFDPSSCGEYPEKSYSFIRENRGKIHSLKDFIKLFNRYFEEHGHKPIHRYPVIARWRDDLLLTIASIACFQPWVTSGIVEPPANPLVIHQPSMRFEDYTNVGYTGRHSIAFTMSAHHAFNKYWKEEMLELAYGFFTEELGLDKTELTFKLSMWSGGGNAGECYEVIAGGLELATLVLMHYAKDPQGSLIIEGERYSESGMRIIDTGYGAERIVWFMTGKENLFEANYPELVSHYTKHFGISKDDKDYYTQLLLEGKLSKDDPRIKRLAEMYRLIDFLRVIVSLAHDGAVPSNKKEGYLLRLSIRQAYSILWRFTELEDLYDGAKMMFSWLKENLDPQMNPRALDYIKEILEIEKEKFKKLVEKFKNYDFSKLKDISKIVELYETKGLPIFYYEDKLPVSTDEILQALAAKQVKQGFKKMKVYEEHVKLPRELPATRELFYEQPYTFEAESNVLWISEDGRYVVLDQTIFYPEGGGQPSDTGFLENLRVKNVFRQGKHIVHEVEGETKKNAKESALSEESSKSS
jgi:alanyl-tRNA synthetase